MGLEGSHQKGCYSHHHYHRNLGPRNHWKCQIQMCFELEELNLKVVMTGLEMRVRTFLWMGRKLWGWGCCESIWIRGVCSCVEL